MRHIGKLYWFSHSQNLKKDEGGRGINGRGWLHLSWGDPDHGGRSLTVLSAQWVLFRRQHSIGVSLNIGGGDSDRDIDFSIRVPWFGIYLGIDNALPRRWRFYNPGQKYPSERSVKVAWHNQALWIDLWADPDESWGRGGPSFWKDARSSRRQIVIHPLDILFGRTNCTTEQIGAFDAEIGLEEANYPVRVVIERRTWTRPRVPWRRRERVSATVESETGIPIPGKGENGWDCGEDAYFSIGTPAATAADAVRYAAAVVLETRERYGGRSWTPQQETA